MPFDPALENVAALLAAPPITWGFCGGWSIDLFVNRVTRLHKDVDVAILRTEQRLVFDSLRQRGWTLEQAADGKLLPFEEDEFLELPVHTIWCRNTGYAPDFLEILLNESEGEQFLFRRDHSIRCPLSEAFVISPSGLPILAPEIALLYKSNELSSASNHLDFQSALPLLHAGQRQWLAQALRMLSPEHEWLKELL
ncbi:MAG: amino acid transporter [Chloroflexota bacterium]|nr:amino acid transporter [Chloroflexota bacterium]